MIRTLWGRMVILGGFFGIGLAIYAFIYTNIGGYIPFVTSSEYTASVELNDIDNIVTAGHVSMAGIQIGQVRTAHRDGAGITVEFALAKAYAPLHQGVRVRLGERSLVGESYLDVVDGTGPALPTGTVLRGDSVQPSTQLRDVLASLDPVTRQSMSSMLRSVGAGTEGTAQPVAAMFDGFDALGGDGYTALTAIAAQSDQLKQLGHDTSTLLDALDTGRGQIATMVGNAQRLTHASAGQRQAIADTMRVLPGVLDSATAASSGLTRLSAALTPVAADLTSAAPDLSGALQQLPDTTADLHGLLPALAKTLDRAPDTLHRTGRFGADARDVIAPTRELLRDVNPMVHYIRPYGPELAGFLANFNGVFQNRDERGVHYVRLMPVVDARSLQSPIVAPAPASPLAYTNPYPNPGSLPDPGPFTGAYPRVERLPK